MIIHIFFLYFMFCFTNSWKKYNCVASHTFFFTQILYSSFMQTHERDLNSLLAMKLRREMLLALANKTCYPDNKEKQEKMIHKYHEFIIPVSIVHDILMVIFDTFVFHVCCFWWAEILSWMLSFDWQAEEAEWVGLTVSQALNKAFKLRKAQPENQTKPLKEIFEEQLVLKLHCKCETFFFSACLL